MHDPATELAEVEESEARISGSPAAMPATHWRLVLSARDRDSPGADAALASLCEAYWFPLYKFVRRSEFNHHDAQDLTQAFFQHLLQRDWLQGVDQAKGRFRTFLLCALANFLANHRQRVSAVKRGGLAETVACREDTDEPSLAEREAQGPDASVEFDQLWCCALAKQALCRLQREYERCGRIKMFRALSPLLTSPVAAGFYEQTARRLQCTEGALRIRTHRLFQRFGELLRTEVARTVSDPELVEEELRAVVKCWARSV